MHRDNETDYKHYVRQVYDTPEDPQAPTKIKDLEMMNAIWETLTDEQKERLKGYETFRMFLWEYKVALAAKPTDLRATFLYTIRSHLRGKIHMRWWRKYHGYSIADENGITGTEIKSLSDQEKWLREQIKLAEHSWQWLRNYRSRYPGEKEPSHRVGDHMITETWISIAKDVLGGYDEK